MSQEADKLNLPLLERRYWCRVFMWSLPISCQNRADIFNLYMGRGEQVSFPASCCLARALAHIYLLSVSPPPPPPQPPTPTRGCWAALLKEFGQSNREDQEHQNSCWECFTHSVPQWDFLVCVWVWVSVWGLKSVTLKTHSPLSHLKVPVALISDNDDTYVNTPAALFNVSLFHSPSLSLSMSFIHSIFFFSQTHNLPSSQTGCRAEWRCRSSTL